MRIFITGATGFIGRALVPALAGQGHQVVAWVRSGQRASSLVGGDVELLDTGAGDAALVAALERCDAVVNLAGEPIVGTRWTETRRRVLRDSRVGVTTRLVDALGRCATRPRVLVSGSAVGAYGDRGDDVLTEASTTSDDFLATLCLAWEQAAASASALGLRVVLVRTGIVLGRDGGALAQMLPPFRAGLGGPIASGRQYMAWIHLHDFVRIITTALTDERYSGVVNGVGPRPVTSRDFATALGRALHRPAVLPTPAFALRLLFGEAASVLTGGARVEPERLRALGFTFTFADLDAALRDILSDPGVDIAPLAKGDTPPSDDPYLTKRPPTYLLRARVVLDAPIDETFRFFSRAENLGLLTPSAMRFQITGRAPALAQGTTIDYRLYVGPVPMTWRTRIAIWEPGRRFADAQEAGPYRSWWHEHLFRADGDRTIMEDRVYYAPPLGLLGRLAHRLFIAAQLRLIFAYRRDVIRLRFGVAAADRPSRRPAYEAAHVEARARA